MAPRRSPSEQSVVPGGPSAVSQAARAGHDGRTAEDEEQRILDSGRAAAPGGRAPTGTGLADWVGVAGGCEAAGVLVPGVGVAVVAVVLGERLPVAGPLLPGENVGGVAGDRDGDDEQAATEASMAAVMQLAAASLALGTMRTLMGSPHASGRWRGLFRSR